MIRQVVVEDYIGQLEGLCENEVEIEAEAAAEANEEIEGAVADEAAQ